MSVRFAALDLETLRGATVVLDVDGTLLPDGEEVLAEDADRALKALSGIARVYLCSNAFGTERTRALAARYGVRVAGEGKKKPDPSILKGVEGEVVVVGDKYLTDGLLAAFTRSRFVKVERIRGGKERYIVEVAYLLDALLGPALFSLARALRPL